MTMEDQPFRVLLVEDDDDHAELTVFHLTAFDPDLSIVRIEDGLKALEYLRSGAEDPSSVLPDLILLDLKLPRLDGIGVLEKLNSEPAFPPIPIVMLSTSNAEHDKAAAYRNHVNSYVVKPTAFEDFGALMRNIITYWRDYNRRPEHTR